MFRRSHPQKDPGKPQVWNPTVANLTLLVPDSAGEKAMMVIGEYKCLHTGIIYKIL